MYCVKCGVELADSQRVCPLCGTRVFHPDIPRTPADPPYPPDERVHPEEVNRSGVCFILTALALLPAVICVLCDWRINGGILWSGYASGGILLLYVLTVLPLWFKRPNPVIFVPVDFAAIILYLLYIDLATGGHWFLTFASPWQDPSGCSSPPWWRCCATSAGGISTSSAAPSLPPAGLPCCWSFC